MVPDINNSQIMVIIPSSMKITSKIYYLLSTHKEATFYRANIRALETNH